MLAIELYTPVLPARTGTANYFELFVDSLLSENIPLDVFRIYVDFRNYDEIFYTYRGIPVSDYRQNSNVVREGVLRFYFVANNTFHAYIIQCISTTTTVGGGCVKIVYHEPCCFMLSKHVSENGIYQSDLSQLERDLDVQYHGRGKKVLNDLFAGNLHEIVDYVSLGRSRMFEVASEIWVHSRFAFLKLFLESNCNSENFPNCRVLSHPLYKSGTSENSNNFKEAGTFRIGAFGWVSRSKRVVELIKAFSLFIDRLPIAKASTVDLIIVGKLPPRSEIDIQGLLSSLDISDRVTVYDYVSKSDFADLISSCDVLSNLRFPSCGETSGTMAYGHDAKNVILATSYQSFVEEVTDFKLPVAPFIEEFMIANSIHMAYHNWADAQMKLAQSYHYYRDKTKVVDGGACPADRYFILDCVRHIASASYGDV